MLDLLLPEVRQLKQVAATRAARQHTSCQFARRQVLQCERNSTLDQQVWIVTCPKAPAAARCIGTVPVIQEWAAATGVASSSRSARAHTVW